jgi:solute:Na+ symporter, SSS family
MSLTDWAVLVLTLLLTLVYGIWKSRGQKSMDSYFRGSRQMPWFVVLLSIMGTQASAVTFLSAPGQAYTDGMRFVQYYFGLPLAMVVLSVTFVPVFRKFGIFTAYEFLEQRFDLKTRTLTSALFLLSRGLSTGISILAPSIILSAILGWNVYLTNIFMGGLLIIYTVAGGTKAVAYTQSLQFTVIFGGMFLAGWMIVRLLPENITFTDALQVAGKTGRLNLITTGLNFKDPYNLWSGLIGGFFLALSYFGTDQSQVGRYIAAKSVTESRMGLLLNGLVKIPMQFLILLIGALLFVFYQFAAFFQSDPDPKSPAIASAICLAGTGKATSGAFAEKKYPNPDFAPKYQNPRRTGSQNGSGGLATDRWRAESRPGTGFGFDKTSRFAVQTQ